MALALDAIPLFMQALRNARKPDSVFRYIDGVFEGFKGDRGRELYTDWERIFIENDDQALLTKFYEKYRSLFPELAS